jgi:hypothetical protein
MDVGRVKTRIGRAERQESQEEFGTTETRRKHRGKNG